MKKYVWMVVLAGILGLSVAGCYMECKDSSGDCSSYCAERLLWNPVADYCDYGDCSCGSDTCSEGEYCCACM